MAILYSEDQDILDFTPPPKVVTRGFVLPWRLYFDPVFFGLENIDSDDRYLFVGNHTLYAIFDAPLYVMEIYLRRGVYIRSLGDNFHFYVPGWRELLTYFGTVRGNPENCSRLMEAGENVLVFPGGAREAFKRDGEQYMLTWKQRVGFARMAIQHGYKIIPVASVGADNTFSILVDADDIMNSPVGALLKWTGLAASYLRNGEVIPPLVRGLGPTLLPRPERFYISFGKPIDTAPYAGKRVTQKKLWALREEVEGAIYSQIRELLHFREQDTQPSLLRHLLTRL